MTDYVTLEDFRAWLRTDDTFDDNLLQIAITSASFWIDQRCGRTFGPAAELAETRYFRPTTAMLADVDDIAGTDDLVIATSSSDDDVYDIVWPASDYLLEPLNGRVNGVGGWPYSQIRAVGEYTFPACATRPSLEVTAQFGWPAVPPDIAQACRMRANYEFELARAALGVAGFGEFGALRVRDLPVVEQLLMPYRSRQVLVA